MTNETAPRDEVAFTGGLDLSETQKRVVRLLKRSLNGGSMQLAGNRAAPLLSAARALARKGLAFNGTRTGWYGLTPEGKNIDPELLKSVTHTHRRDRENSDG
ncbi:hypothetical protein [Nevskia ramosa]|uniref:hypothetical protein n=1 Tax=Nevskia ramosa TaxID=64002 RepID=UPI00235437D1|nr:hypothetical protein [Nevskia ramosa]